MAKRRVKAGASSTTPGGTTNPSQEAVTVLSPTVNGEGNEVPPEIKNEEVQTSEKATNEEVANVVIESGGVASKEEEITNEDKHTSEEIAVLKNGEAAADKEKSEMASIEGEVEDEVFDEPNTAEEAVGEYSEQENEEEDDEEEGDDAEGEEEEDEEEGEEEKMEIEDEEAGEEEEEKREGNVEALLLVKTDEKIETKFAEVVVKTDDKIESKSAEVEKPTSSKKKLVPKKKNKPKALGKQKVASTEENKPKALSKKKVAATAKDKPEASIKKEGDTTKEDKPEASSGKKKKSKRSESMGLIFMCNSKTKKDCYQYKVLGLPASKKDIVQKVYKGMRLFLFDIDKRLMYGIYKAAGPGGYDIQPKAFGSAFPAQVRFTVLEDCLPLAEELFKPIIKDNYFAKKKFDCQLNSEQVRNLCKLFSSFGKISRSKNPKKVAGAEAHKDAADSARSKRPRVGGERSGPSRIKRKRVDEERLAPRPKVDRERRDRDRIRRPRLEDESRIRRRMLDEERVDRERIWDPLYHDRRPVVYERERYPSPLPPPSRAYDPYYRTAESAVYMRDPVVDHRSRLPAVDHYDRQILGSDPYASYREYNPPPPRVQPAAYPPLASSASEYRIQPLASSASEYRLQPHASSASEYRFQPHASSASEYRLPEEPPRYEYAPSRPLYRY